MGQETAGNKNGTDIVFSLLFDTCTFKEKIVTNSIKQHRYGARNFLKQKRHRYCFLSLVTWLVLVSLNRK